MSTFSAAAKRAQAELASDVLVGSGEQTIKRLTDPLRLREGDAVAACGDRFVDYELDLPGHGKGVGRATSVAVIPPLESILGTGRIAAQDDAELARLREAVGISLAAGYLGLGSLDDIEWNRKPVEVRLDVDPAQVWGSWVGRLGANALDSLNPPNSSERVIGAARKYASSRLSGAIDDLGLMPKRLKRLRLKMVEAWYVDAGMILRLVQGSPAVLHGSVPDIVNRLWPFEPQRA